MCGAWLKEGGADVEGLQKPIWRHDMLPMTWQKDQSILFFRKVHTCFRHCLEYAAISNSMVGVENAEESEARV